MAFLNDLTEQYLKKKNQKKDIHVTSNSFRGRSRFTQTTFPCRFSKDAAGN